MSELKNRLTLVNAIMEGEGFSYVIIGEHKKEGGQTETSVLHSMMTHPELLGMVRLLQIQMDMSVVDHLSKFQIKEEGEKKDERAD